MTGATAKNGVAEFKLAPGAYTVAVDGQSLPSWYYLPHSNEELAQVRPNAFEVTWFVVKRKPGPVHFIWYGTNPPSAANTATPGALLKQIPGVVLNYWCLDSVKDQFSAALPGAVIRSIDDLVISHGLGARIQEILSFYVQVKCYAPAKDLITFMVLALEGGFFFDANCTFGDCTTLHEALLKPPGQPACVAMSDDVMFFDPSDPDQMEWDALQVGSLIDYSGQSVSYPKSDLWAMFGPLGGSQAFQAAVVHYIKRARRNGFYEGAMGLEDRAKQLREEFINGTIHPAMRRPVVGAVGIQSIFAAMHQAGQHIAWNTRASDDEYWIDSLGLHKRHGNSW